MKRIAAVLVVLAFLATPSFALLHIGVSAGYAHASMDHVKNSWEKAKARRS